MKKNPYPVILFDEIEKAHGDIFNVFLQIMDNAAITDSQGRKADFRNVVVIFTTNAGSEKAASLGFGSSQQNTFRDTAIKSLFKPEFRNRLDETVYFNPLPMPVILQVVHKFIHELETQLATRKVTLNVSQAACEWFANRGFDSVFGARPMARLIQKELKNKLADEILFGTLKDGGAVKIDIKDDALTFQMA